MKKKKIVQNLFFVAFLAVICVCFYISFTSFGIRQKYLEVEAGTKMEYAINENNIRDYIYINPLFINKLTVDATQVNIYKTGEYTMTITNNANERNLKLIVKIVDTEDPLVKWYDDYVPEVPVGVSISAEVFVESAEDDAGIWRTYFITPEDGRELSFTPEEPGTYTMPVVVQDLNANKVTKEVTFVAVQ